MKINKILLNNILLCLLICCFSLQLCACAPKNNIPQIKAEYYPQCVKPFEELAAAQKKLTQRTVGSAFAGAAGGALLGALLTGDVKGALIGGVLGGVTAGSIGYVTGKQKQIKDVQKRLRSYETDMAVDINNMSHIELYSMLSLQCYIREFKELLNQYKQNKIKQIDFKKRYSEINFGMTEIGKVLDSVYA